MDGDVVTAEKVIHAPPGAIFALLADAARHPDIDGSGSVKKVKTGAPFASRSGPPSACR